MIGTEENGKKEKNGHQLYIKENSLQSTFGRPKNSSTKVTSANNTLIIVKRL